MKRRNFFLPDNIWEALQEQAKAKQTTVSEIIRQILLDALGLNGR